MPIPLKQSTAKTLRIGRFVDKTDGVTAITGIASGTMNTNLKLSKDHAAGVARNASGGITHDVNGWYLIPLDATDTNTLGRLTVSVYDSTVHVPVDLEFVVLTANVYDSLYGGTDALDISVIQWLGSAPNALISGRVEANIGAVQNGVIAAASFAANALDAVWSTATRLLTAGTNIVLAKGAGVTGFNDLSAAQVNAEVLDVLVTDTFAEPAAVPAATSSLKDKLNWVFIRMRNKHEQDGDSQTVYADDGTTPVGTAANSDNGTTYTISEFS